MLTRQAISPQLEEALGVLRAGSRPAADLHAVRPSLRADSIPDPDPVVLVAGRRSGLEAAGDLTPEAARESLRADSDGPAGGAGRAGCAAFGRTLTRQTATP